MANKSWSIPGGAVSVSFEKGQAVLELSEKAALGGGQAAGVISIEGDAKAIVSAKQGLDLAFAIIEAHLPESAALIAKEVQAFADAALDA